MEIKQIKRVFISEKSKIELPDPNPQMPVEQVQQFYSGMYPELTTATYHKVFKEDTYTYTFKSIIGTKG